jgi:hypothetical protein
LGDSNPKGSNTSAQHTHFPFCAKAPVVSILGCVFEGVEAVGAREGAGEREYSRESCIKNVFGAI